MQGSRVQISARPDKESAWMGVTQGSFCDVQPKIWLRLHETETTPATKVSENISQFQITPIKSQDPGVVPRQTAYVNCQDTKLRSFHLHLGNGHRLDRLHLDSPYSWQLRPPFKSHLDIQSMIYPRSIDPQLIHLPA